MQQQLVSSLHCLLGHLLNERSFLICLSNKSFVTFSSAHFILTIFFLKTTGNTISNPAVLFCLLTAPICHSAFISFSPPAWIHQFKSYLNISPFSPLLKCLYPLSICLPFFFRPQKTFPLPCTQISFSPSIFYPIFSFALEFEDGISGTQKGYIIFCWPLLRLPGSLSAFFYWPPSPIPDVLPCHFDGSVGQSTTVFI